jgi:hypothetical protein
LISRNQWRDLLRREAFTLCAEADLTLQMRDYFETLANISDKSAVPKEEAAAWENALRLAKTAILVYGRIIARKATQHPL